jgi:hypothetical protein
VDLQLGRIRISNGCDTRWDGHEATNVGDSTGDDATPMTLLPESRITTTRLAQARLAPTRMTTTRPAQARVAPTRRATTQLTKMQLTRRS